MKYTPTDYSASDIISTEPAMCLNYFLLLLHGITPPVPPKPDYIENEVPYWHDTTVEMYAKAIIVALVDADKRPSNWRSLKDRILAARRRLRIPQL